MKNKWTTRAFGSLAVVAVLLSGGIRLSASAGQEPQGKAKHYKATRAFVVDKQSGNLRLPTQQEVDEVVANLSTLGQRPEGTLQEATQSNGAVSLDLDGGYGGIVLARPNGDGTWETRCVFTLEEGAAFLGIVEDDSVKG
jgi:hypothetical protein